MTAEVARNAATFTRATGDDLFGPVVAGGSPDPWIQLIRLGSSDGSTLPRSRFISDFASEKFILSKSSTLSAVM